jgi:hypothetical protein
MVVQLHAFMRTLVALGAMDMTAAQAIKHDLVHPLETVELLASRHDWFVDRSADDEINMIVAGSWTDLHLSLNWNSQLEGLHLACSFDMKVPQGRRDEIIRLVAQINEQLFFGHFDVWRNEGSLMFRNSLLLTGQADLGEAQCEALVHTALDACERYFPAFQFVIWAGKSADEAIQSSLLETVGEA